MLGFSGYKITKENNISKFPAQQETALSAETTEVVDKMSQINTFNFNTRTVTLNSGYEMPIYGIGIYSLLNEECADSVSTALKNGVRLIDTAYMYHNEESVGEAARNSGIARNEIFVTTKLYPNQFQNAETADDEAVY